MSGRILVGALLAFAFLSAIFQVADHDVGYHIKTGEWIDTHGRLPDRDPFSFTRAGAPWPLQQGISAWILYRVHQAGGVAGLIAFKAAVVVLIYGLVGWVAWRESGSLTLATAATALGILAGRYRFYERPMLFSALCLAILWACLTAYRRRPQSTLLVASVLVLGIWANLHAGWIDGMITLGIFALSGTLTSVLLRYGSRTARLRNVALPPRNLWLAWGAALVLSLGSLWLLNPNGPKVLLIPFTMMRSDWFQKHVAEFLPLPLGNFYAVWTLLTLTGGVLALAWLRNRLRLADGLLFLVYTWGTLTVNRKMLLLSVLAPPMLAGHAALFLKQAFPRFWRERREKLAGAVLVAAMCAIVWFGFIQGDRFRFGFGVDERSTPVGAFRFIEENALPGEVWNEDAWGGSFLWYFWPRRRNFVDNRLGVFDEVFFRKVYVPVREGWKNWEEILDRYGVKTLLMEFTEKPIGIQERAFRSPRWALVYWDDLSLVYVRRCRETDSLVSRFGYQVVNPNSLLASLSDRGRLRDAIRELERAVATTPRSWRALNGLGVAYGMAGRYREAALMFRRVLEVSPRFEGARSNLRIAERRLVGRGKELRPTGPGEGS